MPLYRRGQTWYIDLRGPGGGRTRRSTGLTDKRAAKRQHDQLAARLWQARQEGRRLDDALLAWAEERPRGASDLRHLRLIRAALGNLPLYEVTEARILDALGDRSAATYNRIVAPLRSALNLAERRGWLERAPKLGRRTVPRRSVRWLTRDEWKRLRAALPAHLRPMAEFAVATGLRWSNVAGLTWDRVDLRRRLVTIGAGEAKNRRAIAVPLSTAALAALRGAPRARTGFVFTLRGKPLRSPKTAWRTAVTKAGIDPVRWHDLRHTWASWHVQAGTPLAVLRELGGWATLDQVMVYAHLGPSHLARYAENAVTGLDTGRAA